MSMSTTNAMYGDCVSSLRSSLSFLESSVNTLGTGVEDYPRLVSVLKTVRVSFPPLLSHPAATLRSAQRPAK